MKQWEGKASTSPRAIKKGLKKMGLGENQVDIHLLEEETSSLFSLFGYRRVFLRLAEKQKWKLKENKPRQTNGKKEGLIQKNNKRNTKKTPEKKPNRSSAKNQKPGRNKNGSIQKRELATSNANKTSVTPRVIRKPEELLSEWKQLMGWEDLTWTIHPEKEDKLPITLKTEQSEKLTKDQGKPLQSFQHLFNVILNDDNSHSPRIVFSLEGYINENDIELEDLIKKAVEHVQTTEESYSFKPMKSSVRRFIHKALENNPDVETFSEGAGSHRRVVIKRKQG